ncbi:ATP-dependent zinc metalloprotease FTSH 2, chloroplastic [Olea europaea subsp. europaea]|uniref:ATP-dependent zinc metalloprotease FTSH 2, chloroplastic n=1 Tax=Olea europaea subsp. europaea TaxID=158383 RepID=A0A8S0QZS0_OLEEU|nr:ATP-dependent zinc metalloprotease FTSH 2, chloroplastic [Olea europaea subsp. europaea]
MLKRTVSLLFNLIGNLVFPLILIGGLFLLSRWSSGGMGGPSGQGFPLAFGQSNSKFQMELSTGVTFDDVAGVNEAKQDFMEVVEFLKKPQRFTSVGARSELVEMFVSVGASRVLNLFKKAREMAWPMKMLTPGYDPVQKVTLVPCGQARGLTWLILVDDPTLISKRQLFARIVDGLGGRAAEEIIFGEPEVTTGAAGDLQQFTGLARQMVLTFGMSELGPWSLMDSSGQKKLAEDIDAAVKRISDSAYEIALSQIRNNLEAMDKIVEVLEKETMSGDEFRAMLSEFAKIPAENRITPTPPVTI